MNEKLKNDLTEKMKDGVSKDIDIILKNYIYNFINFDNDIDYYELKESILLSILKLKS